MELIIGRHYKTTKHNSINVEYRDKGFVVIKIDRTHIHIRFDTIDRHRTIAKERWEVFVMEDGDFSPKATDILKFHFT